MTKTKRSPFQCPKCGIWADDSSLIKRSEGIPNEKLNEEFGTSDAIDWIEYHKCPFCKTKFEFENSNDRTERPALPTL